jgi:hypothetical protein
MPLALTCDCGARFELEDALAGRAVSCPECQAKLTAPAVKKPVVRTSHLALVSAILALVGAFTAVGGAAAVLLGGVALLLILRDRRRVGGLGFALFGVVAGGAFTALTPLALSTEGWGLGPMLRRVWMADQLEPEPANPKAPREVKEREFVLTKPSERWGKARSPKDFQNPAVQPLLKESKVLLVQPESYAFVDVRTDAGAQQSRPGAAPASLGDVVKNAFVENDKNDDPSGAGAGANDPSADDRGAPKQPKRLDPGTLKEVKSLPTGDNEKAAAEFEIEVRVDGRPWKFLIQAHRTDKGKFFIVRGFTEASRFERVKDDLRKAVESFKLTADK